MSFCPARVRYSVLVPLALLCLLGTPLRAQIAENNPRLSLPASRLNRTFESLVLVTGHLGFGQSFEDEYGTLNYGGSCVFRPAAAASFWDMLYRLNTAMVVRLDYQELGETGRLLSGDFVLRRYLSRPEPDRNSALPFLGLGVGASDLNWPAEVEEADVRYWSFLAEAGCEVPVSRRVVLIARIQYRYFSSSGTTLNTWAASGAIGIPVPW